MSLKDDRAVLYEAARLLAENAKIIFDSNVNFSGPSKGTFGDDQFGKLARQDHAELIRAEKKLRALARRLKA